MIVLTALFWLASVWPSATMASAGAETAEEILTAARENPRNIGNCYHFKNCLGETIGNTWIEDPKFCGPLGGQSWRNADGRCFNLRERPYSDETE
ncbi:MAG: hypothetical protein LBU12_05625 [Deltaproteobacteria bacterium]|jgi:hypothetical protein|nr:hypothetical protein [Deltaproteobacteria bacterium]